MAAPLSLLNAIGFNPRPPRGTGATVTAVPRVVASAVFQSSPAPRDGRYPFVAYWSDSNKQFQSSPAPRDGRYPFRVVVIKCPYPFQSSPAPRDGRYFPSQAAISTSICFNPRPPRGTGATAEAAALEYRPTVSILARPEGRALLRRRNWGSRCLQFQSSPAPRDGRYLAIVIRWFIYECFNPRPPRGTGATDFNPRHQPRQPVSILARPEGRALHRPVIFCGEVQQFQSSPAPRDGRYHTAAQPSDWWILFQSSPAPRDGRYLD